MAEQSIEKHSWNIKDAQQACRDLEQKGRIEICGEDGAENLSILDKHFFTSRNDAILHVTQGNVPFGEDFLTALAGMHNVKYLNLVISFTQDFSVLAGLSGLLSIHIRLRTDIKIDFISNYKALESFQAASYKGDKMGSIKSYAPLAACSALKTLSLAYVKKVDFSFAKNLRLEKISLEKVTSYQNLDNLFSESLKYLGLGDIYTFTDLAFLAPCTNIEEVHINRCTGLTSLQGLTPKSLRWFRAEWTKTLCDLTALYGADKLEYIVLDTLASDVDAKSLGAALAAMPVLTQIFIPGSSRAKTTLTKILNEAGKGSFILG